MSDWNWVTFAVALLMFSGIGVYGFVTGARWERTRDGGPTDG